MIPGVNPAMMKQLMRQMKMQEVDAEEVIIKTKSGIIRVTSPQVVRMNMMGNDTFQVTGEIHEESSESEEVSEDDMRLVMEKTGASKEKSKQALEEADGDIAEAIMKLS